MIENPERFVQFLVKAKQNTYAAGGQEAGSSRPASHDLRYAEGDYLYIDSYLGGIDFAGEEGVWVQDRPVWSMNYYGTMHTDDITEDFSKCLKQALLRIPPDAPYRGPAEFRYDRHYLYRCYWQGDLECFQGHETIFRDGQMIYELWYHGGRIRQ